MTIEYAIITILAIALLFQSWRKRTWKRRHKALVTAELAAGVGSVFGRALVDAMGKTLIAHHQQQIEWPELIDEKK